MKRNPLATALKRMGACEDAVAWVRDHNHTALEPAWAACECGDWMLWLLAKLDPQRTDLEPLAWAFAERALRFAATGLREAAKVRPDQKHRERLEHEANHLDALKVDSRDAAWAASDAAGAASDAAGAASDAARAASDAARSASAAAWAASAAAWAASDAARSASDAAWAASAAAGAARDAAWKAECKQQADYIRAHVACPTLKGESE